jgi:hypothetical protein
MSLLRLGFVSVLAHYYCTAGSAISTSVVHYWFFLSLSCWHCCYHCCNYQQLSYSCCCCALRSSRYCWFTVLLVMSDAMCHSQLGVCVQGHRANSCCLFSYTAISITTGIKSMSCVMRRAMLYVQCCSHSTRLTVAGTLSFQQQLLTTSTLKDSTLLLLQACTHCQAV